MLDRQPPGPAARRVADWPPKNSSQPVLQPSTQTTETILAPTADTEQLIGGIPQIVVQVLNGSCVPTRAIDGSTHVLDTVIGFEAPHAPTMLPVHDCAEPPAAEPPAAEPPPSSLAPKPAEPAVPPARESTTVAPQAALARPNTTKARAGVLFPTNSRRKRSLIGTPYDPSPMRRIKPAAASGQLQAVGLGYYWLPPLMASASGCSTPKIALAVYAVPAVNEVPGTSYRGLSISTPFCSYPSRNADSVGISTSEAFGASAPNLVATS